MNTDNTEEYREEERKYVDFSPRMYASIIDVLWTAVLVAPLSWVTVSIYGESKVHKILDEQYTTGGQEAVVSYLLEEGMMLMVQDSITRETPAMIILASIIILFWIRSAATPGKLLLNMKIIDYKTGNPPSTWQCIVRALSYHVSALPLCLGFMMINWNKNNRALHDFIAGTAIIRMTDSEKVPFIVRLKNWFRIGNK
jgi:uncharacterized RDD family membrane protein YckC